MGYIMRNGEAYGGMVSPTVLIATLGANQTSVAFTDNDITSDARYQLFVEDKPGLKPTDISISGTTLTATYPAQTTATRIKLIISENINSDPGKVTRWFSDPISALANATSVTISDSHIHTNSIIYPSADNGTTSPVSYNSITTTEGQVVIAFDALAANTVFYVEIINI